MEPRKVGPIAGRAGSGTREAGEILEGERKARSGIHPVRKLTGGCQAEDATVHAARRKDAGGVGKPDDRLRRAVKR
jgi:hypothetical protein